jgi:hypothetical protein
MYVKFKDYINENKAVDLFPVLIKFVDYLKDNAIDDLDDINDVDINDFIENCCNLNESKKEKSEKKEEKDEKKEEKSEKKEVSISKEDEVEYLTPGQRKLPAGLKAAIIKRAKKNK